jgi:hypothetical protein
MRLRELVDTALAAPFAPEESQVEEAIYPSLMALAFASPAAYSLA